VQCTVDAVTVQFEPVTVAAPLVVPMLAEYEVSQATKGTTLSQRPAVNALHDEEVSGNRPCVVPAAP
jgi:hypothetical protein